MPLMKDIYLQSKTYVEEIVGPDFCPRNGHADDVTRRRYVQDSFTGGCVFILPAVR
jgi:hypothetical protein